MKKIFVPTKRLKASCSCWHNLAPLKGELSREGETEGLPCRQYGNPQRHDRASRSIPPSRLTPCHPPLHKGGFGAAQPNSALVIRKLLFLLALPEAPLCKGSWRGEAKKCLLCFFPLQKRYDIIPALSLHDAGLPGTGRNEVAGNGNPESTGNGSGCD